jgi:hypothetical protein
MKRLKEKWKITSNVQFVIILVVFAITGSLSSKIAKPFCAFIGLDFSELNPVLAWILRLIIILPIYQILLIIIGSLFGQFRFFWEFEKKIFRRIMRKK